LIIWVKIHRDISGTDGLEKRGANLHLHSIFPSAEAVKIEEARKSKKTYPNLPNQVIRPKRVEDKLPGNNQSKFVCRQADQAGITTSTCNIVLPAHLKKRS
jgi:hypothetical protein